MSSCRSGLNSSLSLAQILGCFQIVYLPLWNEPLAGWERVSRTLPLPLALET